MWRDVKVVEVGDAVRGLCAAARGRGEGAFCSSSCCMYTHTRTHTRGQTHTCTLSADYCRRAQPPSQVRNGPGAARIILIFHIISARPSKQPLWYVPTELAMLVLSVCVCVCVCVSVCVCKSSTHAVIALDLTPQRRVTVHFLISQLSRSPTPSNPDQPREISRGLRSNLNPKHIRVTLTLSNLGRALRRLGD